MLPEKSESESVSVAVLGCLSAGFGLVIVSVIFIGGHRFLAAFFPDAIVRRTFSQSARHLANMGGDRAATRADIVHADFPGLYCVIGHFTTSELVGFELIGKRLEAGAVAMLVRV